MNTLIKVQRPSTIQFGYTLGLTASLSMLNMEVGVNTLVLYYVPVNTSAIYLSPCSHTSCNEPRQIIKTAVIKVGMLKKSLLRSKVKQQCANTWCHHYDWRVIYTLWNQCTRIPINDISFTLRGTTCIEWKWMPIIQL